MSRWTHAICDHCWRVQGGLPPARWVEPEEETCCWCQQRTASGIYVRADPATVPCKGVHADA